MNNGYKAILTSSHFSDEMQTDAFEKKEDLVKYLNSIEYRYKKEKNAFFKYDENGHWFKAKILFIENDSENKNLNTKRSVFERIEIYQKEQLFHPLTCRVDSCRDLLNPEMKDDAVVLVCPSCSEIQEFIPPMFLEDEFDTFIDSQKNLFSVLNKMKENDF